MPHFKSEINTIEIDNAKDIVIVMPMYTLVEYSDNYSKTSGNLWQYCKDEPHNNLTDSESFKSKIKITGNTPADSNTKDVKMIVPVKYLSNFWRTIETSLINCEVILILTWSSTCVIANSTGAGWFKITDTKFYVAVGTLSTQDNAELHQQWKSGFKRTIKWNKYESDQKTYPQNQYLNHLVDLSFQGVNRLFVLSFEDENVKTSHSKYHLPKVEIKDYNVKTDSRNFSDQSINNNIKTDENVRKIVTENCIMIAIDLSKQQDFDADPRAIQQINFTANLDGTVNT